MGSAPVFEKLLAQRTQAPRRKFCREENERLQFTLQTLISPLRTLCLCARFKLKHY
jgi:hypothetical protein